MGAATLWLHHPPKAGGSDPFRGGSGFLDAADVAWEIRKNATTARLELKLEKYRPGPEPDDLALRIDEETPDDFTDQSGRLTFEVIPDSRSVQQVGTLKDRIGAFLEKNQGAGLNEIADAVLGRKKRILEALEEMEGDEIYVERSGKKHRHFLQKSEASTGD